MATIGGSLFARNSLGTIEGKNGRYERAFTAKLGDDDSSDALKKGFKEGYVSKEDFAAALRGHQAAVNATKSPQREAAAALQ